MKKLKLIVATLALTLGLVAAPLAISSVANAAGADDPAGAIQDGVNKIGGDSAENSRSLGSRVQDIVNVLLFILGAVAVVMIVIGGVRFAISAGDSSAVKGAKDTILYAVVGLVVAILAYAIVNFVVGAF